MYINFTGVPVSCTEVKIRVHVVCLWVFVCACVCVQYETVWFPFVFVCVCVCVHGASNPKGSVMVWLGFSAPHVVTVGFLPQLHFDTICAFVPLTTTYVCG